MKTKLATLWLALGVAFSCQSQTTVWTGSGGNPSFETAANWSGGIVPGPGYDVFITNGSGASVTISNAVTIGSLQCSKALTLNGGALTLTRGDSRITGPFQMTSSTRGASLTVKGAQVSLEVTGSTTARDASFYALEGAVLQLPQLCSVSNMTYASTWRADGSGSILDLSSVTNLAFGFYIATTLDAQHGAKIDLAALRTAPGAMKVNAEDPGTIINLSGLTGRWSSRGYGPLALSSKAGASILIPHVTELEFATLAIQGSNGPTTAQLELLTNVTVTVDAATPDFSRVSGLHDTSVSALNGAAIHLTNVTQAIVGDVSPVWRADGPGSLLDLSKLTTLVQAFYPRVTIQASSAGTINLRRLINSTGTVAVQAQDPQSLVDLSGLTGRWTSSGYAALEISSENGSSVLIPNVTQLEKAHLSIKGQGAISTSQLNLLTNSTIAIEGATPDFGRVTNIDDTSVSALNGAEVNLTNVTRVVVDALSPVWRADGAGSRLDLSRLTTLTQTFYPRVTVQAWHGGTVDLHRLSDASGTLSVDAQDTGSVVDLSSLARRWTCLGYAATQLSSESGATVLIPNITEVENVNLTIKNTGVISTDQIRLLTNAVLTVDGAAPSLSSITNLDDTSIFASNGAVVELTNLTHVAIVEAQPVWRADGPNTRLDLSRVTTLTQAFYPRLTVQAWNGGTVDLRSLSSTSGTLAVDAQDPNSVVDLSGFSGRWTGLGYAFNELSSQNGSSLLIPNVTQMENARLVIKSTGLISTAQLNLLTNAYISVEGAMPDFAAITNIDNTSVFALNDATVNLTNVTRVTIDNTRPIWRADGASSVLNLSRLSGLSQTFYDLVYLQAWNGGTLDLRGLSSASSALVVDSQDAKSVIDLSGLSSLLALGYHPSSLQEKDGGTIKVSDQGFLFSHTTVNVAPGSPVLPSTAAATNILTVCAKPWHTYWVESRDTAQPGNPWVFLMRIPLTNSSQLVEFKPSPGTELRIWEFIGQPAMLEMSVLQRSAVKLTLYGVTNRTYQVWTTDDLADPTRWKEVETFTLTNSFHHLPAPPALEPARFYRWQEL